MGPLKEHAPDEIGICRNPPYCADRFCNRINRPIPPKSNRQSTKQVKDMTGVTVGHVRRQRGNPYPGYCRKGLHPMPKPGKCMECRKANQKRANQRYAEKRKANKMSQAA